jgi:hypothetical protein
MQSDERQRAHSNINKNFLIYHSSKQGTDSIACIGVMDSAAT